ncbi:ABC transporter, ATPase subunit [Candidatus Koribacter versatilis Ellin345]|uniref:ABC transporter, ATPase subunit n=1 Tax=Koribacter versatilis (strain Ellin345) TaxID=204669 RepID=Q1IR93_KORVE|nr:ATP-binding cassette domain-containing protein [Candidatus Koribacter versatilis]ABF40607.1 ABC transporter, ATPase subunit [Candidatus Koribacter versatilis Ellin345]
MTEETALIDFREITVMRGDTLALDGLSLKIAARENVAIIGPNGCGKSTLLKTITRELYPLASEGTSARIMGREQWDVAELREHLGVVSNDLFAGSEKDPRGLEIAISGFFSSWGLWPHHHPTEQMIERSTAAMRQMGVEHLAKRRYSQMSSGERKRVLISRALVHDPDTLVLDEPSDSLDLAMLKDLQSRLRQLAQTGTGIVMVTHHLHEVVPEITRVVLLRKGRVFRDGAKREVLTRANLSELYETDVEPVERDGFYQYW